ncbi:MAG: glycosyltransferase family 2 protein [Candidatus Aegiribacteria sp.]|nr:glycosyltransferase family 2 protein [Candidatus Aegiribacteria sp.]
MYRDKRIGIVVPAYNEETQIEHTVNTMPDYVDKIIVIDDMSKDHTVEIVERLEKTDNRVLLIRHEKNGGVGKAIGTGYIWCRENNIDIAVVMAGDGQMDPDDMPALLDPVVENHTDYTKGNRLITGEAWKKIPRVRYLGNSALTFLTKIASGYWHVTDSQTGYTALNHKALHLLPLEDIYPRYGMPNDFLVTCNIYSMRVMDVPINPVYDIGEKSGIKISRVLFTLPLLLLRLFSRRMIQKYIIRDFHPLIFFYALGFVLILVDIPLIIRLFYFWATTSYIPKINALAILFCTFMGMQSILFAMLFDMEANRKLKG